MSTPDRRDERVTGLRVAEQAVVSVGAIVLTHGEHDSYETVVADLLSEGMAARDICVVHNPVRPDDRPVVVPENATAIRMPGNVGYAQAMNAGMRHHLERGADWIWLLTHDVRLHEGAMATMRRAATTSPEFAALGPVLLDTGTDTVFSLGGERSSAGHIYNAAFGTPRSRWPLSDSVRPCAWLDGSSIMLRARALEENGLYDTSLFGYTEDAFMCLNLERAGWSVGVVESAVAEQTGGAGSRPGPVAFLLARNGLRYAHAAGGGAYVRSALRRQARETLRLLRVATTGPDRQVSLVTAVSSWIGVAAFLAGRSGPPPAWLPGRGDTG